MMPHILLTSANETISEETGDHYPVLHDAVAQSAQSAEKLRNALQQTEQ